MPPALPRYRGPWNERTARHLLNRAGFGLPEERVRALAALTIEQAVDSFLNEHQFPDSFTPPSLRSASEIETARDEARAITDPEQRQVALNQINRRGYREIADLRAHWLLEMRRTNRPLQEKMVLFWHGHFAAGAPKVRVAAQLFDLNQVMRRHALGNFRNLTFDVGASPAMLIYLDNRLNRRGSPNENWARELMELFVLGIGNYTERDIREAARAFTGYGLRNEEFFFDARQHDGGEKVFLGRRGNFDGRDIIMIIFEQPEASRFLPRKLWEYFAYEEPEEAVVEGLASVFKEADYEIRPLLREMFLSEAFYSQKAIGQQVKGPVQYTIGLMEHLRLESANGAALNTAMRSLGQNLFAPPNVKGWPGNRAWINTNTLFARYNIPGYVLAGWQLDLPRARPDDDTLPPLLNMREMSREERSAIRGGQLGRVRITTAIARQLIGRSCGEVVDQLIRTTHSVPLSRQQRQLLVQTLSGDRGAQFVLTAAQLRRSFAPTLRLLLSTAEYQLC